MSAAQVNRDALREFIAARQPVTEYVARRYASHNAAFRELKRASVTKRVEIALDLLASQS